MSEFSIVQHPNKTLREKCFCVKAVGKPEQDLLSDMEATMHKASGVGLAASQIGIQKQIAVVNTGESILKMVNPKILSRKGVSVMEEGCLSVPKRCVNVKRAEEIEVSYINENDHRCRQKFKGLAARIIQHEIDHLNGRLIIDYLPWPRRLFA